MNSRKRSRSCRSASNCSQTFSCNRKRTIALKSQRDKHLGARCKEVVLRSRVPYLITKSRASYRKKKRSSKGCWEHLWIYLLAHHNTIIKLVWIRVPRAQLLRASWRARRIRKSSDRMLWRPLQAPKTSTISSWFPNCSTKAIPWPTSLRLQDVRNSRNLHLQILRPIPRSKRWLIWSYPSQS